MRERIGAAARPSAAGPAARCALPCSRLATRAQHICFRRGPTRASIQSWRSTAVGGQRSSTAASWSSFSGPSSGTRRPPPRPAGCRSDGRDARRLEAGPATGLLGYQVFGAIGGVIVQYRRSSTPSRRTRRTPAPGTRRCGAPGTGSQRTRSPEQGMCMRPPGPGRGSRSDLPEHDDRGTAEGRHTGTPHRSAPVGSPAPLPLRPPAHPPATRVVGPVAQGREAAGHPEPAVCCRGDRGRGVDPEQQVRTAMKRAPW